MSTFAQSLAEYSPQMETYEFSPQNETGRGAGPFIFADHEEMELAAELLEVSNEQELEQFLGSLIKKAGRAIGSVVRSPIGQAIGGVLKTVAKKALPIAGGALGGVVGGPLGATIGSGLANMAGNALGLELEGLSQEDREFEATKQFIRFAGDTVKRALENGAQKDPATAAQMAAAEAARTYAPGLLTQSQGTQGTRSSGTRRPRSGNWTREGGRIVLHNV